MWAFPLSSTYHRCNDHDTSRYRSRRCYALSLLGCIPETPSNGQEHAFNFDGCTYGMLPRIEYHIRQVRSAFLSRLQQHPVYSTWIFWDCVPNSQIVVFLTKQTVIANIWISLSKYIFSWPVSYILIWSSLFSTSCCRCGVCYTNSQ